MAFTEPTDVLREYLVGSLLAKEWGTIFDIVSLTEGEKAGNKITLWVAQRSTADDVDGTVVTFDEDNVSVSLTCADKILPHFWSNSKYQTAVKQNRFGALLEVDKDALGILMETALDTLLTSNTNTQALATDNTFTVAEVNTAITTLLKYNVDPRDCVLWTGAAGAASILTNFSANTGGAIGDLRGPAIYIHGGQIPVYVSAQCTISASTDGAAGYLFAKQGVLGGINVGDVTGPQKMGPAFGGWGMSAELSYAFGFPEGTGDPRIVKFKNP